MPSITKSQILWVVLVVVFVLGGVVYLVSQKGMGKSGGNETAGQQGTNETSPQVLNMAGVVSAIDVQSNAVTVKNAEGAQEIKLNLLPDTEIVRLKFPFDSTNPPKGETTFTPERLPIKIADLKSGDRVLVETKTTLYGKTELNDVVKVQVLP